VLRRATALPFAVLVAASATGWLYLVRPSVPGPRIGEALPLDELSRHAASPVVWYVLVWLVAGSLLGLVVRWSGTDRLTAAVVLGITVGLFEYLQSRRGSPAFGRDLLAQDAGRLIGGVRHCP